ncbi:FMN-binding glutamate synthase family protein [Chitinophagaceae bacterium LB-8]|uniref:FMN-binding glutamate synthase family protein n=1 Tax=Paraflavisolibacter caeni TaxID=2982496 RepID=A0A9X2XV95_9BACT|nr:FMN-binding glutamate synthase family protein [Paraflavisolibacter caeni]MCU7549192.1 FMN-binding glutamate synthase family protein [Paraflavisolibacter caeni]
MTRSLKAVSISGIILSMLIFMNAIILKTANKVDEKWYWALLVSVPLLLIAIRDIRQKKHAIIRNYPLIGHLRYFLEAIRPELRQYFFESDLDGKPFNRRQRSIVYQRAKNERQSVAFGMQSDPMALGYEWIAHSVFPVSMLDEDLRVKIGNKQCLQPYQASILNIGAMSYGALSKTAIVSLNEGAKIGGFAHNTGEGGISAYHLQGGDLIWQIGTGYFGCRSEDGKFNALAFRKNALHPQVKMIELKLSQGAKPGHGGILPAAKNTPEIAAIRLVVPGTTILSPSRHAEFDTPEGMMRFIHLLRELSEGKPVGFKICIGDKQEFIDICQAISSTGIIPDFISIDGAEGGTGAAPLEFTDHLGMPLYDALAFVKQTLDAFGLSEHIKIIVAGKIITGFDIIKVLSLGASACYSARGMMMALGCIQALICDSDKCPVGVTTQNPSLYKGLHPSNKRIRVANFHAHTIAATKEIMEACGFKNLESIHPSKLFRRINEHETKSFEQIYFKHKESSFINNLHSLLN